MNTSPIRSFHWQYQSLLLGARAVLFTNALLFIQLISIHYDSFELPCHVLLAALYPSQKPGSTVHGTSFQYLAHCSRYLLVQYSSNTTKGLFSVARHINYTSYTLRRAAFALVEAGPIWAGVVGLYFWADFVVRASVMIFPLSAERV